MSTPEALSVDRAGAVRDDHVALPDQARRRQRPTEATDEDRVQDLRHRDGVPLRARAACTAWWSWYDTKPHQVEWVGVVALALSGLLCLMCGGYFWFVSRRIDLRPEDRDDGRDRRWRGRDRLLQPGQLLPVRARPRRPRDRHRPGVPLLVAGRRRPRRRAIGRRAACSSSTTPAPARPTDPAGCATDPYPAQGAGPLSLSPAARPRPAGSSLVRRPVQSRGPALIVAAPALIAVRTGARRDSAAG